MTKSKDCRSNRVQVLLDDTTREEVERWCGVRKKSASAMCSELIEHALSSDEYKDPQRAQLKAQTVDAAVNGVDLGSPRIKKLLQVLKALDELE